MTATLSVEMTGIATRNGKIIGCDGNMKAGLDFCNHCPIKNGCWLRIAWLFRGGYPDDD
jgi:hypothetical protein